MKLRLLLPLIALPVFASVGSAQTADPSPSQLRRDFNTVQQQRDALAAQVDQLKAERDAFQAERDALKNDAESSKAKVVAAETSAVEASEAVRAQKEAEMTVDMTVRAYALKEQEAIEANKLAAAAAEKLRVAELARDAALAEAEQSRQNAAAEVARTTAERDAAKQSEAAALAAKAAMQNELYAAQIRIENLSRALSARSGVPFTPSASIVPTPVATEQPAVETPAAAPVPAAAAAPVPAAATPAAAAPAPPPKINPALSLSKITRHSAIVASSATFISEILRPSTFRKYFPAFSGMTA